MRPDTGKGEKEDFYEFGEGSTPRKAVEVAIYNADTVTNYSHMMAKKKIKRIWDK